MPLRIAATDAGERDTPSTFLVAWGEFQAGQRRIAGRFGTFEGKRRAPDGDHPSICLEPFLV